LSFALLLHCAPTVTITPYSFEKQLLVQADSLFKAGNYEYAILKYIRIRDEYAKTGTGAKAQFWLGYINIFYDNPFADYNVALREFKRFQAEYPDDARAPRAKNWIRILTVLQDFDKQYHGNNTELIRLEQKQDSIFQNYEALQDAYLRCDSRVDSLRQKVQILQGIIEALDSLR